MYCKPTQGVEKCREKAVVFCVFICYTITVIVPEGTIFLLHNFQFSIPLFCYINQEIPKTNFIVGAEAPPQGAGRRNWKLFYLYLQKG